MKFLAERKSVTKFCVLNMSIKWELVHENQNKVQTAYSAMLNVSQERWRRIITVTSNFSVVRLNVNGRDYKTFVFQYQKN